MIRKLSLAVAVATALSPVGIFALGLGDIHTQSALNQRFKAEIDLLSVSRDELQDVRAALASPEAFVKAGVDRPFLLSLLRFTPSVAPDGRMVITVNSEDPIREPYMNFLLEVNWPKGRLLREYTVLLDPPVTLARSPSSIQSPSVAAASPRQLAPAQPTSSAMVAGSFPAPATGIDGAREYGPVHVNDNLWQIAQSMRREGETVEQVMMAIQRYNPNAFLWDNVNDLKVGKILRLPEGANITGMSHRDARREFLSQTREWRERRSGFGSEPATPNPSAEQAETAAAVSARDRLKLVSTKSSTSQQLQGSEEAVPEADKVSRLEQEILLAQEENASVLQENEVLQSRIHELESQVSDMRRLLTLKSDELAQLQTAQQIIEEKTDELTVNEGVTPVIAETAPTPTEAPEAGVEPVGEGESAVAGADIEVTGVSDVMEAQPPQQMEIVENLSEEVVEPVSEAVPEPATEAVIEPVPVQPGAPASMVKPESSGFLEYLKGNSTLMGIVGAMVVLLGSLLWLIVRRRKEAEAEFAESILVTPEGGSEMHGVEGATGSVNEPSEETSFMSDFSPSDIDALQDETGEVDPISEADVYIAYGRYQQAEELIKQAIERFPEREELKHKLLEIYYSAKNKTEFVSLAEGLKQTGLEKDKPEVWARISSMGKELDPGNALFSAIAGVAAAAGMDSLNEAGFDDLDFDLNSELLSGEEEDTDTSVKAEQVSDADDELMNSMDMSDFSGLDEVDSESVESSLSLDSEFLRSLESEELEPEEEGSEEDLLGLSGLEDIAGSIGQVEDEEIDLSSKLDDIDELSGLELSDADLGGDEYVAGSNEIGLEDSETLDDLDLESLEKELELLSGDLDDGAVAKSVADDADMSEVEALDLDAMDEVTTKLDLARAYVDMGDAEGAKNILEEVVTEGSDEQKEEAQALLGSLAS